MDQSALIALLSGPEMISTDNIVIIGPDGNHHTVASVVRTGLVETTLPSGVPDVAPAITITLA